MNRTGRRWIYFALGFFAVLGLMGSQIPCFAAKDDKELPDRMIQIAVEYPGVEIASDDDVSMDIIFYNKGKSDEDVDIQIENIPENWKVRIKTYQFTVTSVHVPSDDKKTISVRSKAEKDGEARKIRIPCEGADTGRPV